MKNYKFRNDWLSLKVVYLMACAKKGKSQDHSRSASKSVNRTMLILILCQSINRLITLGCVHTVNTQNTHRQLTSLFLLSRSFLEPYFLFMRGFIQKKKKIV